MQINISRFTSCVNGTFSLVFIDNIFFSFSLEPKEAVIPLGTWPLIPVNSPTWTPKLGGPALWINWKAPIITLDFNGNRVWQLTGDKSFTELTSEIYQSPANDGGHALFHSGDTVKDTTQCIILDWCMDANTGITGKSMLTVKDFYAHVLPAAQRGEAWVEIKEWK